MHTAAANQHDLPQALPAFRQIARQWNGRFGMCTARILPGEYYVTRNDEMITTVLGSCISACIRDPDTGVGGMNHFMLPGDTGTRHDQWGGVGCLETRFGVAAMENLLNEVLKQGACKQRLELKLFGGGKVMAMQANNVGQRNIDFVIDFVAAEGLTVMSKDLGGPWPRKVKFFPRTGKVMVKRIESLPCQSILEQEKQYESTLGARETPGEIDLF